MVGFDGCLMEFWWNFDGFCRVWWMFDRFLMEFWWIWDRCSWILDGFGCFYGNFSLGLMNECSWTWLVLMDFEVSSPHFIHWWIITIFMDLRWGCHSPIFRQPKKMRGLIYDMYIYIYTVNSIICLKGMPSSTFQHHSNAPIHGGSAIRGSSWSEKTAWPRRVDGCRVEGTNREV